MDIILPLRFAPFTSLGLRTLLGYVHCYREGVFPGTTRGVLKRGCECL